ncbi:helix-turn-helix domain-containing protein [Pedobacter gandavensis]|uniref:helix-turn-helix domain-containing protein n=1 Tax=Pedobacter gandavensis TaxID=2679963 RepID=UPI0039778C80
METITATNASTVVAEFLTVKKVARLLNTSVRSIYNIIQSGRIKVISGYFAKRGVLSCYSLSLKQSKNESKSRTRHRSERELTYRIV